MDIVSILSTYVSALVRSHITNERGASLVEYALLVALIAVVCIGAATFLGGNIKSKFSKIGSSIGA